VPRKNVVNRLAERFMGTSLSLLSRFSEELGKERTSPVYLSLCIDWENVLTVNSDSFL